MHHRPSPTLRSAPSLQSLSGMVPSLKSKASSPKLPPLLPSLVHPGAVGPDITLTTPGGLKANPSPKDETPTICGMPLKYVSLVTLAVQNAALSIVMHYSRVSTPPSMAYSPAAAVLFNELLKGTISFLVALTRTPEISDMPWSHWRPWHFSRWSRALKRISSEVFSPDCWKLSIPALLYVIQNSLQFVAISNLPVASFQVTYQMKILTTAAFSVALLGKRLSSNKWFALFFLALGVGIVQIQSSSGSAHAAPQATHNINIPVGSAHDSSPVHIHVMSPLKGFGAVTAACFTSGLAGVYFEMVLKGSKADLWVRNIQLSLFSLIPALLPILYATPPPDSQGLILDLFRNFGGWAWATVAIQVIGGLITAIVIKYSDNILKGFATSLSIIISFLASVALFDFRITWSFIIGASTVLIATWMYNQPPGKEVLAITSVVGVSKSPSGRSSPLVASPVGQDAPILGMPQPKKTSPFGSPRILATALGFTGPERESDKLDGYFGSTLETNRYLSAPYGSPFPSRSPTPAPTPPAQEWR